MLQRRALLAAALPTPWARSARAQALPAPPELASDLPGAQLLGQGRLSFLGLQVYDARLWAGVSRLPADWSATPLALELGYARSFKGAQIAERSLTEMKRLGDWPAAQAGRWLSGMKQLFPDVQAGDRITGLHLPGFGARFFFNGQLQGDLRDAAFARLFFGIWLSDQTSEPALRAALLGRPK